MFHKNQGQTDRDFLQLKGNVKQVMQTVYKATTENGITVPGKIEVDHGSDEKNFLFTFGSDGNIIEKELYGQHFRSIDRYSTNGKKTEEIKYYQGQLYSVSTYTYNEKGQIVEYITNNAAGILMHRYTNTYTPDTGQPLLHISYHNINGNEVVMRRNEHTYRDEVIMVNNLPWHQPLTTIEYDKDGKITSNHTYVYNEKGLLIENTSVYKNTPDMGRKITYKHNEHGDVIETNFYNYDGTLKNSYVTTHQYDSEGKKIIPHRDPIPPFVHRPHENMIFKEGDETDEKGNWIKKITQSPARYITRMLLYEGEEKTLEHPLLNVENIPDETEREVEYERYKLKNKEAKWIAEWPSATGDNFPVYRYYTMRFKEAPSMITFQGPNIEAMLLLKQLKEKYNAVMVHSYNTVWNGNKEFLQKFTLNFNDHWGYMLNCHGIGKHSIDEFVVTTELEENDSEYVYTSHFSLYHPSDVSKARDEDFEREIADCIDGCNLRKKPEKPVINIIEFKGGNFMMREYAVHDDFIIKDLDINYGQGFEKFHNELMQRFNSSTKGLVLFHGEPGTGKTYYIRHLLRKMVANRKEVIYIPPNMVDHLVDPSFMTFLSGELKNWSEDGYFCVLLIEDAEPLLAKRQEGVRIQGVTNLLNMTDGLLNDMLNLQIICTFNVDLSKLDSALLRPGRLIARKEFKPLSELDANILAQRLGIKHHFDRPASLGEIYALQKNKHTLVHDVEANKNTSSAIDDL